MCTVHNAHAMYALPRSQSLNKSGCYAGDAATGIPEGAHESSLCTKALLHCIVYLRVVEHLGLLQCTISMCCGPLMKLRNIMQAVQQGVTHITLIMAFKIGVQGLCDLQQWVAKQVCEMIACHHRYGEH